MKRIICTLVLQFLIAFALSFGTMLLRPVKTPYLLLLWGMLPLMGSLSAFIAARKGVNPYLSWLIPPVSLVAAALLSSMGSMPHGGALTLNIVLSVFGAAAADTYAKIKMKGKR